jgi:hypothetical protein
VDQCVDIQPEQVVPVLMESQDSLSLDELEGVVVVQCEGVDVCTVQCDGERWRLERIACNYPVHGCHPRMEEVRRKLAAWAERAEVSLSEACPACDGSGWLPADNERARLAVLFAMITGLFRGIAVPTLQSLNEASNEDLHSAQESGILDALLFERSPSFSDRVPRPGPTAPGRGDLFSGEDQGQDEGKGETR